MDREELIAWFCEEMQDIFSNFPCICHYGKKDTPYYDIKEFNEAKIKNMQKILIKIREKFTNIQKTG